MTTVTKLPFTYYYAEDTNGIGEILYEFVTNALDASAGKFPVVIAEQKCIVIEDKGKGVTMANLSCIGRDKPRDVGKHGSHGSGLKDAISCAVRKDIKIIIETKGRTFTFTGDPEDAQVIAQEVPNTRLQGTKVTVPAQNPAQVLAALKPQFLFLMDPAPRKYDSKNPLVEIYETSDVKGAVMMMGVKKDNHPPLGFIYNFVAPNVPQKGSIARNQTLTKGCFKKHFRDAIAKANPQESFGAASYTAHAAVFTATAPRTNGAALIVPTPQAPAAPAPPLPPAAPAMPATVQHGVARDLDAHCMAQDYHVWTLTSADRERVRGVAANIVTFLRTIRDIRVAATIEQGSLAKNTFVPLSSDIDVVVEIVGFHGAERRLSDTLKQKLRDHGCRMEDSGVHILNFTYQDVQFDLVLIDTAKQDPRSALIHAQGSRTQDIVGSGNNDRQKLQSFIRAAKYWSKRQNIAIKSCSLEMAVLALWPQLVSTATVFPFRFFLQRVVAELNKPVIKDYYGLTAESIAEVGTKAAATLALLP